MNAPSTPLLLIILPLLLSANPCNGLAQTVAAANQLEIGPTNSNQVVNSVENYSAAIGKGNLLTPDRGFEGGSLAVGQENYLTGQWGYAFGYYNKIEGGTGTMAVGGYNDVVAADSLFVGHANTSVADGEYGNTSGSLVVGSDNEVNFVSNCLVVGSNNYVSFGGRGATIGEGLTNWVTNCLTVGKYNVDDMVAVGTLFVVGNGRPQRRSNAFEVYDDGAVIIPKRQGDIRMGEFGLNGD